MNYLEIFAQLNAIPRPSHHEERVADYLCNFAKAHGLRYQRDKENCVVIEKDATPGYEDATPIVILNHMDMVCVAKDGYLRDGHTFDPLTDDIRPYIDVVKNDDGSEIRWMKAEGTSLGADNGMGLSMALAILANDDIVHGPLEVLTTTNEEDGMSGAEALSTDFIRGRKVINLDSEAYNEITTGAAGAYIQVAHWTSSMHPTDSDLHYLKLTIDGGLGGHSGVDIHKKRCNANREICQCLEHMLQHVNDIKICSLNGGVANASISPCAEAIIAIPQQEIGKVESIVKEWSTMMSELYSSSDPNINIRLSATDSHAQYILNAPSVISCVTALPYGVMEMREDMPDTVMTSNNIGVIQTTADEITVSCHSRSFSDNDMHYLGKVIKTLATDHGARTVDLLMDTPAWMESDNSPLLNMTCDTFADVLGFRPKRVAMHFVLEAAYYVQKYPGIEIASIGPRIVEPHSTSERVDLDTAEDIWRVTVELLKRLAEQKNI